MMIKEFSDKVIFYKECPAQGGACMCMGTCNEIDFEIPIEEWNSFLDKFKSQQNKLTSTVTHYSGVFPYGYSRDLMKRTGELKFGDDVRDFPPKTGFIINEQEKL